MTDFAPGTVWLVGAGPGDPELLTRKAERLIRAADVVFHDAMVGSGVLDLIPPRTERISVGKRKGRHSKDQRSIDQLIVAAALGGKRVVRLKGGDPVIFGRATEELGACRSVGIPVFVCPGVTAASAAAASVGRSLTLRGHARLLTFVTAHGRDGEELEMDWARLADPRATLAIYMGKAACTVVARHLVMAGLSPSTPVVTVEDASLPSQRVIQTTLGLLPLVGPSIFEDGPAIILVGEAVGGEAAMPAEAFVASKVIPA